jgi:uracil-DNA glycosylase family 4
MEWKSVANAESDEARWQALDAQVIACRRCPRLVVWREEVARTRRRAYRDWDYWGKPLPGFGDHNARVLAVGLAPGAHGANRTGRMFTGDASGDFLFASLYRIGFANQPQSIACGDGLELKDLYIGATCRCAPPDNKPTREEMEACRPFLIEELGLLKNLQGIVALGKIGFDTVLTVYRQQGYRIPSLSFGHAVLYDLNEYVPKDREDAPQRPLLPWLLASYHPSQQNTSTKRLTPEMFDQVWAQAAGLLKSH